MTNCNKLYTGISRAAFGYLFIYLNLNIGNINILPSFIGYLLILSAINYLECEERELSLLRSLGVILALWHAVVWLFSIIGIGIDGKWQFIEIIIDLINLYFHFQLLTNLAAIAAKYQSENYGHDKKLLRYRTVQTLMITAITVITPFYRILYDVWTVISVIIAIVCCIAALCLTAALFDLRRCLPTDDFTE